MPLVAALLQALPPETIDSATFSATLSMAASLHHGGDTLLATAATRHLVANLPLWQAAAATEQAAILRQLAAAAVDEGAPATAHALQRTLAAGNALDALRCYYRPDAFHDVAGPTGRGGRLEPPCDADLEAGVLSLVEVLARRADGEGVRALTSAILDCTDPALTAKLLMVRLFSSWYACFAHGTLVLLKLCSCCTCLAHGGAAAP